MLNKRQIYIILAALCFLVYANSLKGAFVSDDIEAIVKNPLISDISYYWLHPSSLLNVVNYFVAGLNPFVYHLTNIILHSIVTIMVFLFLNLFFKSEASLLAASLFAVHPIHAEAVSWISGRPYLTTALFILSVYFLYNKASQGHKLRPSIYLISILLFGYYMALNFNFYFLFPLFLVLSDAAFGCWRKNWKLWLPFFAIMAIRLIFARAIVFNRIFSVAREAGASSGAWSNPFFNTAYSLYSHLSLLVWPARLTLYHEPPVISRFMLGVQLALLIIIIASLFFLFKKAKPLFLGVSLFILFLAPTYSPVMISWLVAERYVYFPSIMLCMFAAFAYERYTEKADTIRRNNALLLFLFIIAAYGARTVARNEDWGSPERLWRQTALASPLSPRSHNNMGDIYGSEGNIEGAIREFKTAIELRPDYADATHNLANVYQAQGNFSEAVKYYQRAISLKPDLFESRFNLGIIYLNNNEIELAIEELGKAQEIRPDNVEAKAALEFAAGKRR